MKREGRQHGMVRSYRILPSPLDPRPEPRVKNQFESTPTAGLFTKVLSKPTTCCQPKCMGCHVHPVCKSKGKAKGAHKKLGSCDFSSNYKLVTRRVVDSRPGLRLNGYSASGVLDHLGNDYMDEEEEEVDEDILNEGEAVEIKNDGDDDAVHDGTSFCEMGYWWEQIERDGG